MRDNAQKAADVRPDATTDSLTDLAAAEAQDASVDPDAASSSRAWLGFVFVMVALLVVGLDISVTDVAVPSIVKDLGVSADDATLVVTVYMVVAASTMVLMGKVSDLVGARRAFLVGSLVFAGGSFVTGIAPNLGVLLLGRVIQALVLAIIVPASLSLLNHEFPSGRRRTLAFAIWAAVLGSAFAIGPLLGGFFTTYTSWRWAFFINIPIMVVAFVGAYATVRSITVKERERGFDVLGSVLLVIGVALLVFGLQMGSSIGWWAPLTDEVVGIAWTLPISVTPIMLAVGAIVIFLFVLVERRNDRRGRGVVLEPSLFKVKTFTWGTLAAALMTGAVFGLLLMVPMYAQYVLGYNALGSGLTLFALGVGMAAGGPVISHFDQYSKRRLVLITLAIQPLAILATIPFTARTGAGWWLAGPLLVEGFAWGAAYSILVNLLLADVPKVYSGVAGGTQTAARLLAGAFGAAVLTAVLLGVTAADVSGIDESQLTTDERANIEELYTFTAQISVPVTDAGETVDDLDTTSPYDEVIVATKDDMVTGIRATFVVAAVIAAFAFLAALGLPKREIEAA